MGLALVVMLPPLLLQPVGADPGYGRRPQAHAPARALAVRPTQPPVFRAGTLGLCHLYNLSGYFAIDQTGEVLPLQPYCENQQNWVWYAEGDFWQAFRQVASAEAIAFAQTRERETVEAYAQSICALLNDESLAASTAVQTLQNIQANPSLPPGFDQAVTEAATRAYCPQNQAAVPDRAVLLPALISATSASAI